MNQFTKRATIIIEINEGCHTKKEIKGYALDKNEAINFIANNM